MERDRHRDDHLPSPDREPDLLPVDGHLDPWSDTTEGRGLERRNPYESTSAQTPFGPSPETVGIPNMVRSRPRTGPGQSRRPRLARALGLLLLLLVLAPALVRGLAWTYRTLSAWVG